MDVSAGPAEPVRDCSLCPRLVGLRADWRVREPGWHNGPVPTFGDPRARLLVVGLAPGLRGANRTGRPFTGDHAGHLLYGTLLQFGFASGTYGERADDGLVLRDAAISNAVRCVPPLNKPTGQEIATCRRFLTATLGGMAELKAILALGRIAHDSVVTALGGAPSAHRFAHGAAHDLKAYRLFDSYHCSRYNTNTGRLTPAMFHGVFEAIRAHLQAGTP